MQFTSTQTQKTSSTVVECLFIPQFFFESDVDRNDIYDVISLYNSLVQMIEFYSQLDYFIFSNSADNIVVPLSLLTFKFC